MGATAKKQDLSELFLGRTDEAIRLIYWIDIPEKNREQIIVRFFEKRGDGKLLQLVSDRRDMRDDAFRSGTDRFLAEWLYDEWNKHVESGQMVSDEAEEKTMDKDDEEKVKSRLRSLGYLE